MLRAGKKKGVLVIQENGSNEAKGRGGKGKRKGKPCVLGATGNGSVSGTRVTEQQKMLSSGAQVYTQVPGFSNFFCLSQNFKDFVFLIVTP